MNEKIKYAAVAVGAFLLVSGIAYAASNVEKVRKHFLNGFTAASTAVFSGAVTHSADSLLVGGATIGSSGTEIVKVDSFVTAATNIGAGAANVAVPVTVARVGAALGNDCSVVPLLDDAAWDEGSLTCYVESADVVKIVYHPDATGGDPADMTYRVTLLQF